jgi:hypothetical protein
MFALLVLSVILVGGVVETAPAVVQTTGPVQGEAWAITAPSPSAPDDAKGAAVDIGRVDTTVTLDMIIATFRGMTGGDKVVTRIQDAQAAATRGGKAVCPVMYLTPLQPVKQAVAPCGMYGTMSLYNADMSTTAYNPQPNFNLPPMCQLDRAYFLEAGPVVNSWLIPGYGMTPPDPQPKERGVARIAVNVSLPAGGSFIVGAWFSGFPSFGGTWTSTTWRPTLAINPWTFVDGPPYTLSLPAFVPFFFTTPGNPPDPYTHHSFYFDKMNGSAAFYGVFIWQLY